MAQHPLRQRYHRKLRIIGAPLASSNIQPRSQIFIRHHNFLLWLLNLLDLRKVSTKVRSSRRRGKTQLTIAAFTFWNFLLFSGWQLRLWRWLQQADGRRELRWRLDDEPQPPTPAAIISRISWKGPNIGPSQRWWHSPRGPDGAVSGPSATERGALPLSYGAFSLLYPGATRAAAAALFRGWHEQWTLLRTTVQLSLPWPITIDWLVQQRSINSSNSHFFILFSIIL